MEMKWCVKKVTAMEGHRLLCQFADGSQKIYDMTPFLDMPVFRKLKSVETFRSVRCDGQTVYWDEMADIAPETLYKDGLPVTVLQN